ncbi:hypothetical protein HYH02_015475, partial [Chlamydomonas schloesseri]
AGAAAEALTALAASTGGHVGGRLGMVAASLV